VVQHLPGNHEAPILQKKKKKVCPNPRVLGEKSIERQLLCSDLEQMLRTKARKTFSPIAVGLMLLILDEYYIV
jgi:hypothetical protein